MGIPTIHRDMTHKPVGPAIPRLPGPRSSIRFSEWDCGQVRGSHAISSPLIKQRGYRPANSLSRSLNPNFAVEKIVLRKIKIMSQLPEWTSAHMLSNFNCGAVERRKNT